MRRLALLLPLALACAHATPRATVLGGKRVGLGEVVGDLDAKQVMQDALAERFELSAPNPELHLHVDASLSGFDEPVNVTGQAMNPQVSSTPVMIRRVQRLKVTLRLVDDASGEVLATGLYELTERGPERPRDARAGDELGVVLARRAVQAFFDEHKL